MAEDLTKERMDFLAKDYSRGFIEHCRFEAEVIRRGAFQSRVTVQECHRQQDGFIHAGVMATMADHTAGYAAYTTVPEDYQILTIEFKVNSLRPAYGERLLCRSCMIREGLQVIIGGSEVFDQRGDEEVLVAKALVTLMAVRKKSSFRRPESTHHQPLFHPEQNTHQADHNRQDDFKSALAHTAVHADGEKDAAHCKGRGHARCGEHGWRQQTVDPIASEYDEVGDQEEALEHPYHLLFAPGFERRIDHDGRPVRPYGRSQNAAQEPCRKTPNS